MSPPWFTIIAVQPLGLSCVLTTHDFELLDQVLDCPSRRLVRFRLKHLVKSLDIETDDGGRLHDTVLLLTPLRKLGLR
jgi:hypothetical protein